MARKAGNRKVACLVENVAQLGDFGIPLGRQGVPKIIILKVQTTKKQLKIDPGGVPGKNNKTNQWTINEKDKVLERLKLLNL